jgi:hypothetical protein
MKKAFLTLGLSLGLSLIVQTPNLALSEDDFIVFVNNYGVQTCLFLFEIMEDYPNLDETELSILLKKLTLNMSVTMADKDHLRRDEIEKIISTIWAKLSVGIDNNLTCEAVFPE